MASTKVVGRELWEGNGALQCPEAESTGFSPSNTSKIWGWGKLTFLYIITKEKNKIKLKVIKMAKHKLGFYF